MSDAERAVRDGAAAWAAAELPLDRVLRMDAASRIEPAVVSSLFSAGLMGIEIPERYGGAPLLGLRGNVLKAHGSSNRRALHAAILAADKVVRADFLGKVVHDAVQLNALISSPAPQVEPLPQPAEEPAA